MARADAKFGYDEQTPETGTPIASNNPTYLQDPVLDATVRMVVELAAQVWVERERRIVLEAALADRGVVSRDQLEKYAPDAALAAALKAERNKFVEDVFKSLRALPIPVPAK
jgi:hypothetical protein